MRSVPVNRCRIKKCADRFLHYPPRVFTEVRGKLFLCKKVVFVSSTLSRRSSAKHSAAGADGTPSFCYVTEANSIG